jgi:3-methyladenine DNA glycosylase AlkD
VTGAADEVLAWIAASADPNERAKLARYGIPDGNAVGIPMRTLLARARAVGRDMALARALWASGGYEARTLAAMVAEPDNLAPAEMDAWVADFDSWAICDTVAFRLFKHSPHAHPRAAVWVRDRSALVRRAGYATYWALALHDRSGDEDRWRGVLGRIGDAPAEAELIVEKAIIMALAAIARRSPALRAATVATGKRLSDDPARRRVARAALRVGIFE